MWIAKDWAAFGTVLYGVGTIASAMAIGIAAKLGSSTFNSWRKQNLSERRIEQAERILTATYKVRRGLSSVRHPALWPYEKDAAERHLQEQGAYRGADDDWERSKIAQLYFTRINKELDNRKALEECQPIARALFGEQLEQALEQLNQQFDVVAAHATAQKRAGDTPRNTLCGRIHGVLWGGYPTPEENEMDQMIDGLVHTIEEICVPILRLESDGGLNPEGP